MNTKRIALDAVLTALALSIYFVELQLPTLVPIPGVKLGLANIITVVALFYVGPADTAAILFSRILLGSIFSGNILAMLYSISGGILCFLVQLLIKKAVTPRQIWVCSVFGAIAHNIGQILTAVAVTQTPGILTYLPVLMMSGIITGLFTGLSAQAVVLRLTGQDR